MNSNKILIISKKAIDINSIYFKLSNVFKEYEHYFLIIAKEPEKLPFERSFFIQSDYPPYIDIDELKKFISEISPSFIFSPSDLDIKSLLAMIASSMNLGILSDITEIKYTDNQPIFIKPYIKNINAVLTSKTNPIIVTLSSYEMKKIENPSLYEPKYININHRYDIKKQITTKKKMKTIEDAQKVICIGRGVKKEDIPLIKNFAEKIGAVLGYTRPVKEEFELDSEYQIGISGKNISPKLYIAIAVSGKEHHIRAVSAEMVISINTDPNAPIKKYSDYFICQDYKKFIEAILL